MTTARSERIGWVANMIAKDTLPLSFGIQRVDGVYMLNLDTLYQLRKPLRNDCMQSVYEEATNVIRAILAQTPIPLH